MAARQAPSVDYELCRRSVLGHAWDYYEDPAYAGQFHNIMHKRCLRCATVDHVSLNSLGQIVSHHYIWPDGYKFPKDQVPTSEELRQRAFKKFTGRNLRKERKSS